MSPAGTAARPLTADDLMRRAGLLQPAPEGVEEEEVIVGVDWSQQAAEAAEEAERAALEKAAKKAAAAAADMVDMAGGTPQEQQSQQQLGEEQQARQPAQDPVQELQQLQAKLGAAAAPSLDRPLRCAVVNNRNWHLDVAAGLAWAFQEAGCNVTTYLANHTFGIQEVMGGWFKGTHRHVLSLANESHLHDAFVLVTFPETHTQLLDALLSKPLPGRSALRRRQQRFLAVVHNPYRLLSRSMAKRLVRNRALQPVSRAEWAGAAHMPPSLSARAVPRLQLLSLAPAAAEFARALVEQWALNTSGTVGHLYLPWLSPVAPWRPSFSPVDIRRAGSSLFSGAHALRHICIQGILDPKRRDYAAVFQAVSHPAVFSALRSRNEVLLLLGHAASKRPLEIPAHLAPVVRAESGLPYQEYYDTLSRCRAILPAFASEAYLVNKTSSSIAIAINVGTPLLAEERVRGAYPFLPGAAVFSYDPPAGAQPIDVTARAAEFARQYIEEDLKGEHRQAAVAWEKAAWVEEALAWLRDEGVQLPHDMEEKVAAAAAAAAAEAAAEDAAGGAGSSGGGGGGKAMSSEEAAAERRRHLPELKRVAQKAAAGGAGAQRSWRELAVRLAALARVSRRRLLLDPADLGAGMSLGGAASEQAGSMPAAQAAAAAAQAGLVRRAGVAAAAVTPAEAALRDLDEHFDSVEGPQAGAEQPLEPLQLQADGATVAPQAVAAARAAAQPQATQAAAAQQPTDAAQAEEGAGEPEGPPEGSLAAALLQLFEPGAADRAHAAARKLKSEVMKHNKQVAAEFLAGAARLIQQAEAEEAAAAAESAQQQQQQGQGDGKGAAAAAGSAIDSVQLERELYRIAAAERANPTGLV